MIVGDFFIAFVLSYSCIVQVPSLCFFILGHISRSEAYDHNDLILC